MALEGIAEQIKGIEIAGIPLGEAALGGGSALVVSELTDVFIIPRLGQTQIPGFVVKAGEALVMVKWGHKVIGADGARVAALFLGYEAVRSLIPMEAWIRNAIRRVAGATAPEGVASSSRSSSSSPKGNGHQVDAMDTLRQALTAGGAA